MRWLSVATALGSAMRSSAAELNCRGRSCCPRDLTWTTQEGLTHDPAWYVDAEGNLQLAELLAAFQGFFREHSGRWIERFQYREAGPQLLLQAFLQRVVNSGGRVEREYGLRRVFSVCVLWTQK